MSNRALVLLMGFVAALIVVVGAVLVIALRGGGDGVGTPASPERQDGGGGSSTSPAGFCRDSVLITFGADPASVLDPIQVRDEGTAEYVVEIFGGLVTLDLNMKVVPDIAERWDVSPDGLTYTFHLRDDVVFHNGRRVTAEDFKYSFERAADPANASPTVLLYLGNIVGMRERYNNQAKEVEGVKVIDERTLQIRVRQPTAYFLAELTYPVAFVVDRQQVEQDPRNWTRRPNGTGPYRVKEFVPGQRIVLVRNERYHLGVPKLEEVRFDLSGGSLLTRYENNEIHVALVPAIELGAIKEGRSPLSKEYVPNPRMAVSYIAFNAKQPPFDDPKVRQALSMTVDRQRINDVLLFGTQRPADGILPPEMPGYDPSIEGYPYDPERAKRLLAESRYANNMPRVVLTYAGAGGEPPDVLLAIQENWRQTLGIEVELQATEYSAFLRELRRGTFQAFSAGWIADYPDPEDFLDKLFHSQSPQNEMGYRNPEVDRILEQARGERDQQRRFALYHEAEKLILQDAVVIPIFWPVEHQLVKPCVKNWPVVPMTVPKYRYIEISPN